MERQERLQNIEALRTLAMFFIVINHATLNLAVPKIDINQDFINYSMINLIYQCVYNGVNVFVLITGYFLISKQRESTKWSKVVDLWIQVLFYSFFIYCSIH